MDGIELIRQERDRQIAVEKWTREHDDQHASGELALMAATYALSSYTFADVYLEPLGEVSAYLGDSDWFKPKDPIRDLVRAGALIAAEIDRLQRSNNEDQGCPTY